MRAFFAYERLNEEHLNHQVVFFIKKMLFAGSAYSHQDCQYTLPVDKLQDEDQSIESIEVFDSLDDEVKNESLFVDLYDSIIQKQFDQWWLNNGRDIVRSIFDKLCTITECKKIVVQHKHEFPPEQFKKWLLHEKGYDKVANVFSSLYDEPSSNIKMVINYRIEKLQPEQFNTWLSDNVDQINDQMFYKLNNDYLHFIKLIYITINQLERHAFNNWWSEEDGKLMTTTATNIWNDAQFTTRALLIILISKKLQPELFNDWWIVYNCDEIVTDALFYLDMDDQELYFELIDTLKEKLQPELFEKLSYSKIYNQFVLETYLNKNDEHI